MGDWLVWSGDDDAPLLGPLTGVSERKLHAKDYHRASWPEKAACEASAAWAATQPECSVVDGLPLVSTALAERLSGRGLEFWPVSIKQGKKRLTTRFAAIPTQISNCIHWKESDVTFSRQRHLSPLKIVKRMVLNEENLVDGSEFAACINLPNVVFVRRELAAELEAAGYSGLAFCEPAAFSIAFGEETSDDRKALERVKRLAVETGLRGAESALLSEVAALGSDELEDWLDDSWHHHGIHALEAMEVDLSGALAADASEAYRSALKTAILARLNNKHGAG